MRSSVVSVMQSPVNATRWCLALACGHQAWINSNGKPKRKTVICFEEHAACIVSNLDEPLFEFNSFHDWIENASRRFRSNGVTHSDVVCHDSKGRICEVGLDFRRAHDEFSYPVVARRKLRE